MSDKPITAILINGDEREQYPNTNSYTLSFPTTQETLEEAIKTIGFTGIDDPERNIYVVDYECDIAELKDFLPHVPHLDELNYLASLIKDMDEEELNRFKGILAHGAYCDHLQDVINQVVGGWPTVLEVSTPEELFTYWNSREIKENPGKYKDYDYFSHGCQLAKEQNGRFTPFGYVFYPYGEPHRYYNGNNIPFEHQIRRGTDMYREPVVTILWSENVDLWDKGNIPLSEANSLFQKLDEEMYAEHKGIYYDKTKFSIGYFFKGELKIYEGRQDLGDNDGSLIEHIRDFHYEYRHSEQYQRYLAETPERQAEVNAYFDYNLNYLVPHLENHLKLSEKQKKVDTAFEFLEANPPASDKVLNLDIAYFNAYQKYIDTCRYELNTCEENRYYFPEPPRDIKSLDYFDTYAVMLESHKKVREETRAEAKAAGITYEEYVSREKAELDKIMQDFKEQTAPGQPGGGNFTAKRKDEPERGER